MMTLYDNLKMMMHKMPLFVCFLCKSVTSELKRHQGDNGVSRFKYPSFRNNI